MENNRRGNEIFLGVIGVATLVVAIIGATFAYFSATANSAENAINTSSTAISLDYDDTEGTLLNTNLIPASEAVATYAALEQDSSTEVTDPVSNKTTNGQCIDDNGNEVCSVYQFTVEGAGIEQTLNFSIDVTVNGFVNLQYKIYAGEASDLTSSSTAVESGIFPGVSDAGNPINLSNMTPTLNTSNSYAVTYTMVIWLNNIEANQSAGPGATNGETDEAGKSFAATMIVTNANGGQVKGVIAAATPSNS